MDPAVLPGRPTPALKPAFPATLGPSRRDTGPSREHDSHGRTRASGEHGSPGKLVTPSQMIESPVH